MTDKKLALARGHMTATAAGLRHVLGPLNAAGVLIGAAVGVLSMAFGEAKAAEYVRKLADDLDADDALGDSENPDAMH